MQSAGRRIAAGPAPAVKERNRDAGLSDVGNAGHPPASSFAAAETVRMTRPDSSGQILNSTPISMTCSAGMLK